MSYTEIKTFDDVLHKAGKELYEVIKSTDDTFIAAYKKLCLITKVLNNGWYPKMHEPEQAKYYSWFCMDKFKHGNSYNFNDSTYLPLRLAYVSEEVATYSATQFIDVWKDFFEPNTKPNTIIHSVDIETINTFDDVLCIANLTEHDTIEDDDPEHIKALKRYSLVCNVLNNRWNPDFNNSDEYKYYPYYKVFGGVVSFIVTYTYFVDTFSYVGLRFCFKDRKTASFAGSKFFHIIQPYIEYNIRKENILEILK